MIKVYKCYQAQESTVRHDVKLSDNFSRPWQDAPKSFSQHQSGTTVGKYHPAHQSTVLRIHYVCLSACLPGCLYVCIKTHTWQLSPHTSP